MKSKQKNWFIVSCIVPTFILYMYFGFLPCLQSIKMAFYKWSGLSGKPKFIGLKNFSTLFNDDKVWAAFGHNLFLLAVVPVVTIAISLFFAHAITKTKLKEKGFYRVIFFFPNVLSLVVISILFTFIFHPNLGILNATLKAIGLENLTQVWLGDNKTVLWSIGITMVWQAVGYYMVLYMASMEGVPPYLYEAAIIDGASQWQQFKNVTFPLIWEVVRVTIVFTILGVFNQSFAYVNIMTQGGPDNASNVLSVYMYKQAFTNGNFGYAMTVGLLTLIISLILAFVSNRLTKKEVIQY